jgi:hypothetical protein
MQNKYIPGFRSGNKWKMIIASIYYILSLLSLINGYKGVGTLLISIAIPFIIFHGITAIKTRKKESLIMLVVGIIVLIIGIAVLPSSEKTLDTQQNTTSENKAKQNDASNNENNNTNSSVQYTSAESKQGDITEDIKMKINGTYLKSAVVEENKITVTYKYSKNVEKDVQYFETGDKINKVLMEDPFRIIRNYSNVNQIHIDVVNESETYYVDITKEQLENFLGFKMSTIKDNDEWVSKVSNPIFTKEKRQAYVNQYVRVKK